MSGPKWKKIQTKAELLTLNKFLAKIIERWPVKVLSVVAAIILFVFHRMGNIETRFFSVPLTLEISSDLVPSSSYPHNIKVTLRGDANSIFPVAEEDIQAYLDLTMYKEPGSVKAPVLVRKKDTALEVESLEIVVDPMEISLELDTKAIKSVSVVPNIQGSPEKGYELVTYSLQPNKMIIEGPLGLINTVSELRTDPVDLHNRNADFTVHLKTSNSNPLVSIRGDEMIEFKGIVGESILIRNFDGIPISIIGLREDFTVTFEPNTGSVRLEASARSLENFEPPENFLTIDVSDRTPGTYDLPVTAALPEGFSLSRQEPQEVSVRIVSAEEGEE
jgi:YbbR domain-containing protein